MKTILTPRLYFVIVAVYYRELRVEVKETLGDLNMEFDCKFVVNMRGNIRALLCKTSQDTF